MAAGKISIQSTDNKIYTITPEVGAVGAVALTLPKEGGMLTVDAEVVHKTGDETIAGVKTFSGNTVMNGIHTISRNGGGVDAGQMLVIDDTSTTNSNTSKLTIGADNHYAFKAGMTIVAENALSLGIGDGSNLANQRKLIIDTSGNVLVTGSGGLGYGTGSGGTVTQLTSKSTAVTLNKPTGRIIMNNQALAPNGIVSFSVYNTTINYADTICYSIIGGITSINNYSINIYTREDSMDISITNKSSTSLSEPVEIMYSIIRGVLS